tara:strand:+ start:1353 stop:1676 length:324 start_codon:yes stop_codon:yes gene_type:complete
MSFSKILLKKIKRKLSAKLPKTHSGLIRRAKSLKISIKKSESGILDTESLIEKIRMLKYNKENLQKFVKSFVFQNVSKTMRLRPFKQKIAITLKITEKITNKLLESK